MGGVKRSKVKQLLAKMFRLSNWKLAIIAILLCFWSATLLRLDHIKMSQLRNAVLAADESGDEAEIARTLNELKDFTRKHIVVNIVSKNGQEKLVFGTGPIYLEQQYLRAANKAIAAAKEQINQGSTENPNGNVYAKVEATCNALGYAYGYSTYADCWMRELEKYPTLETLGTEDEAKIPPTELYRYEFASPLWYPCLSGFVILIALLLFVIVLIRAIIWVVLRIAIAVSHG